MLLEREPWLVAPTGWGIPSNDAMVQLETNWTHKILVGLPKAKLFPFAQPTT